MKICRDCLVPMTGVMSFSKEKREKFNQCPKCHGETKHHSIKDSELNFGEVLHRESQKQINRTVMEKSNERRNDNRKQTGKRKTS